MADRAVDAPDVCALLAEVLALPPESIAPCDVTWDLPGFTSFALVELVDRLEQRSGCEVPLEALEPERFGSPKAIADTMRRYARKRCDA